MSIWRMFKPDEEFIDDEGFEEQDQAEKQEERERERPNTPVAKVSGGVASSSALEMKICKPEKYEEVTKIAVYLLEHKTVVLNLELTSKDTLMRIIDFLSGVTYAINGTLKRVASSTYVITPEHVDITGEQSQMQSSQISTQPQQGAVRSTRELF